jgi:hypothetical protein
LSHPAAEESSAKTTWIGGAMNLQKRPQNLGYFRRGDGKIVLTKYD